jgi:hypothetical protein
MMLARAYQDTSAFDQAAAGLVWPCAGSTVAGYCKVKGAGQAPRPKLRETR